MYLLVVGIDPGKRIGLGVASGSGPEPEPESRRGWIMADPLEVWRTVLDYREVLDRRAERFSEELHMFYVAVEGFFGSGRRNEDNALTTQYVGWFDLACAWWGYDHSVVVPDARRWKLQTAADALGKKLSYAPTAHDDDDVSALAHALSRYDKIWRTH